KTSSGSARTRPEVEPAMAARRSARCGPTSTRSAVSLAAVCSVPAAVSQSRPASLAARRSRCATKVLDAPAPHTTRILIDLTLPDTQSGRELRGTPPGSFPPLRNRRSSRPGGATAPPPVPLLTSWEGTTVVELGRRDHVASAPGPASRGPAAGGRLGDRREPR